MSRPADPNAKIDLLRAAEAVFVARGLDLARVEDITERAGRSKGAFYLHFGSKEDAFRQIVETMLARLADCIDEAAGDLEAESGLDGAPLFFQRWRDKDLEIFEFIWQNRGVVRLLLEGGKSAAFGYLIDEFAERSRRHTVRMLSWGVRQRMFRGDLDVELASLVIAGAYDRVARELVRRTRRPELARMLGEVQRLLLAGVQSRALASFDPKVNHRNRRPARRISTERGRTRPPRR
ncbi:MAG TPA: helix-turn-helix domain-containing protein [Polyangia bacterium]